MKTLKYLHLILVLSFFSVSMQAQSNEIPVQKESKLYKEILKSNSAALCSLYIANYPEGKKIDHVKGIQEEQYFISAFTIAAESYTDTALKNYLTIYPQGSFFEKANEAIEVTAWQKAHHENTLESYQLYLKNYPEGKAAKMAMDKIEAMK